MKKLSALTCTGRQLVSKTVCFVWYILSNKIRIYIYFGSYLHKESLERYKRNLTEQFTCWKDQRNENRTEIEVRHLTANVLIVLIFKPCIYMTCSKYVVRLPQKQLENEKRGLREHEHMHPFCKFDAGAFSVTRKSSCKVSKPEAGFMTFPQMILKELLDWNVGELPFSWPYPQECNQVLTSPPPSWWQELMLTINYMLISQMWKTMNLRIG